jgi:hypothetical protein
MQADGFSTKVNKSAKKGLPAFGYICPIRLPARRCLAGISAFLFK